MSRWRRYRRNEHAEDFARDLPWNGQQRVPYPPATSSDAFQAPDGVDGWTGYGADGWYRSDGRRVEAGAPEVFNNTDWPLNTSKWTFDQGAGWSRLYGNYLAAVTTGDDSGIWRASARRWEVRGDFLLRLVVQGAPTMTEGVLDNTADADHAIWLGVTRKSDADVFARVKAYRAKTRKGYAVERPGDAFKGDTQVADLPALIWLEIQRSNGIVTCRYRDATPGQPLGEPVDLSMPFAMAGIVIVDFGARNVAHNGVWGAGFNAFQMPHGPHTYSPVASWRRETTHGLLFEQFEGDEADPDLYTTSTSGAATAAPVAGLDAAAGPGLRLFAAGGSSQVQMRALHGDFTAAAAVALTAATLSAHNDGVACGLAAYLGEEQVYLSVEVRTGNDGQLRAQVRRSDSEDPLDELVFEVAADVPIRLVIEREAVVTRGTVYGRDGVELVSAQVSDLVTLPVALRLFQDQQSASDPVTAYVKPFQVSSPWALRAPSWPARTYATCATCHPYEVSTDTTASDATLIDPDARATAWAIYAQGAAATPLDYDTQPAIQPGTIGRPFFDAREASLWLPVTQPGSGDTGAFVQVNLREDEIRAFTYYDESIFRGRVGQRHLGLGYVAGPGAENLPPAGAPVTYARIEPERADLYLWATHRCVTVRQFIDDAWRPAAFAIDASDADPDLDLPFRVGDVRIYAERPAVGVVVSALAFDVERLLCVYRDVELLIDGALVAPTNRHAHASYGGTDPDARWATREAQGRSGPAPAERLNGPAADGGAALIDVVVAPSHAIPDGDGLPLVATTRPLAVTLLQDAEAPAEASAASWGTAAAPDPCAKVLASLPSCAALSPDADIEVRGGFLCVGEAASAGTGRFGLISLTQGNLRGELTPAQVDGTMAGTGSAVSGVASLGTPPDAAVGWRVALGFRRFIQSPPGDSIGNGGPILVLYPVLVLEYDVVSLTAVAQTTGPHIGGSRVSVEGYDFTGEERVYTLRAEREVECFRVRIDEARRGALPLSLLPGDLPEAPKRLSAVVRALGWHEHGDTPVMSDAELAATADWPADVIVVMQDGARLVLPDAFVYHSEPCIEFTARRILGRLPRQRFDIDPKHQNFQRHLAIAIARLICRLQGQVLAPALADTYRATATGDALDEWGRCYAIVRPFPTMSDGSTRDYFREAVMAEPTPQRVRAMLLTILGGEVTIVEGYREFTAYWEPDEAAEGQSGVDSNFYGEVPSPEPLETGFYDRDFYGGVDPRVVAAGTVLDYFHPVGVRPRIVIGAPPA